MKKVIVIIGIILLGIVCLAPLPRRVVCQNEAVQVEGWYLDFLFLKDRFYGQVVADGNVYQPTDSHGAYKLPTVEDSVYMLPVYRYRAESNDLDMRTLYLQANLKDVYEWN